MSLKASGALVCRTISFEGVEFRSLVHSLDAQQVPAVAPKLHCCRLSRGPIAAVSLSQIEVYDQCTELFRRLQRCRSPFCTGTGPTPPHLHRNCALRFALRLRRSGLLGDVRKLHSRECPQADGSAGGEEARAVLGGAPTLLSLAAHGVQAADVRC
jgi:hypothetical protein